MSGWGACNEGAGQRGGTAGVEDYLPAGSDGETTVEIPDAPPAATLLTAMREAGIPESASPLIALNGVVVSRGQHAARTVSDGDAVHFMPKKEKCLKIGKCIW